MITKIFAEEYFSMFSTSSWSTKIASSSYGLAIFVYSAGTLTLNTNTLKVSKMEFTQYGSALSVIATQVDLDRHKLRVLQQHF